MVTPIKLNLTGAEFRQDPWSMYGRLREQGEVIQIKMPFFGKCWAATSYEAVNECLKDTEHFVRQPSNAGRKTFIPMQWLLPRSFMRLAENLLAADGQKHKRLRSLVDKAFAMRNIEGMSDRIEAIALDQIRIVEEVANRDGQFDLNEHFSRPFPLTVICELLGLPNEDRPKFKKWFEPFSTVSSIWGIFSLGRGMRGLMKYLTNQFEEVRKNPRDGILTQLVEVEHEGEQLDENELLSMVFLLLAAGHETTVHLINNAVLTLLQFPEAKAELLNDWSNSDAVIDEVLRYSSPLQMAKPRYVAQDMEFHGQSLKRKQLIVPLLAAANYDPDRFENPETFDIHRERNYHMTFGSGPHVCLGMKLARTETHFALKSLFERWPDLKPAFDLAHPDWNKRMGTRGFKTLFLKTG